MDHSAGRGEMPPRLTLLLVNDEEDGLFLLDHAMKREFPGVETICCRSAGEALQLLADRRVDAVLTDNRMPGLSGLELAKAIRASNPDLPVVMLTGSDEKRQEALLVGVSSFISSGDWNGIRREIRRTIEDRRERSQ